MADSLYPTDFEHGVAFILSSAQFTFSGHYTVEWTKTHVKIWRAVSPPILDGVIQRSCIKGWAAMRLPSELS